MWGVGVMQICMASTTYGHAYCGLETHNLRVKLKKIIMCTHNFGVIYKRAFFYYDTYERTFLWRTAVLYYLT